MPSQHKGYILSAGALFSKRPISMGNLCALILSFVIDCLRLGLLRSGNCSKPGLTFKCVQSLSFPWLYSVGFDYHLLSKIF